MPANKHRSVLKRQIRSNKGIALLMVLWILVLLSVIVGEFCYTMKTQINITRNLKETTQAYYIALAGLNTAIEHLVQQMVVPPTSQASDNNNDTMTEDDKNVNQWRVDTEIPPVPYGNGECTVWIDNEGGKVNINLADRKLLKVMMNGFDLDDSVKQTIVDSIIDWRDADNLRLPSGAEDDYYLSLPQPYECKNSNFDSVDELLLVKGVTPAIFYGGLEQMVTVIPADKGIINKKIPQLSNQFGYNRLNINAIPPQLSNQFDYNRLDINAIPPQLWAALPGMTQDAVNRIIDFRKTKDFQSHMELQKIVGVDEYSRIAAYITIRQSPYYIIHSVGKINGSTIAEGIEAVVRVTGTVDKKYQILQWKEGVAPVGEYAARYQTQNKSSKQG